MTPSNDRLLSIEPYVVAGLATDVEPVLDAVGDHLKRRLGAIPPQCQIVGAASNLLARVGDALNAAMDIRNPANGLLSRAAGPPEPMAPNVVIVASAVSLSHGFSLLEQLVHRLRREFRRSHWCGTVYVLLYLGAVEDDLPKESVLWQLRSLKGVDAIHVFGDRDDAGRRIRWEDAQQAAAQYLVCQIVHRPVRQMVRQSVATGTSPAPVLTFGICRLDLSEAAIRQHVQRGTYERVVNTLFSRRTPSRNGATPHAGDDISDQLLASIYRATNGSLAEVRAAVAPAAERLGAAVRQSRVEESARLTRQAVLSLLPPRRGWLLWLRDWFLGLLRRLLWWRAKPSSKMAKTTIQPSVRPDQAAAKLGWVERVQMQMVRLQEGLCDGRPGEASPPRCPFDLGLADLPAVRKLVLADLPPLDQIVWQVVRRVPLPTLLSCSSRPAKLRAALQALINQCLQLPQGRMLVAPEAYRDAVERIAAALVPLGPDCAEPARRLALLPPQLREPFTLEDYQKASGAEDEIVLLVLQPAAVSENE